MSVVVYRWGGIAFDDYTLSKILTLPSDAFVGSEITFHDEAGNNYQVPAGKVFIASKLCWGGGSSTKWISIGESDNLDASLTKTFFEKVPAIDSELLYYDDVFLVFTAGKYVTGSGEDAAGVLLAGSRLYGVEVSA